MKAKPILRILRWVMFVALAVYGFVSFILDVKDVLQSMPVVKASLVPVIRDVTFALRPEYKESFNELVHHVQEREFQSSTEMVDYINRLVYDNLSKNSVDRSDEAARGWQIAYVMNRINNTLQSDSMKFFTLCGPRALAMKTILDELEIENRVIFLLSDLHPESYTHTFLELYNDESQDWEVYDPLFGIHYESVSDGERMSMMQLIQENAANVEPVYSDSIRGWDATGASEILENYDYKAFMILHSFDSFFTDNIAVINTERFNTDMIWDGDRDLQAMLGRYGDVQVIEF